jgi:hypothetical protein
MTFNLSGPYYVARPRAIRPLDEHLLASQRHIDLPFTKAHSQYSLEAGGQLSSQLTTTVALRQIVASGSSQALTIMGQKRCIKSIRETIRPH